MAAWIATLFLAASFSVSEADRLYAAGDFAKASVVYRGLLKTSPRDVGLLIRLGAAEYQMQVFASSEKLFRSAASLSPASAQAQVGWGTALLALDRPGDAVPVLERAVRLAPLDGMALRALGHAYQKNNQFFQGERILSSLVTADPSDDESWMYLGILLYDNNYYQRSLEALDHALLIQPNQGTAKIYKAGALAQLGRFDEADSLYRELTTQESSATRPELWLGYAQFLFAKQELKPALEAIGKANTLLPDSGKLVYWRAKILMNLGESKAAESDARKAVELSPDSPNGHYLLMKLYQLQGLSSAAEEQARWLALHPSGGKAAIP